MLKVAIDTEEKFGGLLRGWWDGQGDPRVFAHDDHALLMERAEGTNSLVDMARGDHEDEASRLICRTAAELHAPRLTHGGYPLPDLVPLDRRIVCYRSIVPSR